MSAVTAFRLELYDHMGAPLGQLASCYTWRQVDRLDRIGEWAATVPATDPGLILCAPGVRVYAIATMDGAEQYIGAGVIESIAHSWPGPVAVVTLEGPDLLGEWARGVVGLPNNTTEIDADLWMALRQIRPHYWEVYTPAEEIPWTAAVAAGQTPWEVATHLCRPVGAHLRAVWTETGQGPTTPILEFAFAPGPAVATLGKDQITSLGVIHDDAERISAIYPYGAGSAGQVFVPRAGALPSGAVGVQWLPNVPQISVTPAPAVAIERVAMYDIYPLSGSDADVQTAADQIVANAYRDLIELAALPAPAYSLAVAGLGVVIRPFDVVTVNYSDPLTGIVINEALIVLEAVTQLDSNNVATSQLIVRSAPRWPVTGPAVVARTVANAKLYSVSPILNANTYAISYTKRLDTANPAQFRFRLDSEITQLAQVRFDWALLPLESSVRGAAGQNTASGATPHYHRFGIAPHRHRGEGNHKHTIAADFASAGAHSHTLRVVEKAGAVTNPLGVDVDANGQHLRLSSGVDRTTFLTTDSKTLSVSLPASDTSNTENPPTGLPYDPNTGQDLSPANYVAFTSRDVDADSGTPGNGHSHAFSVAMDWGVFRDSAANVPAVADLEYRINGGNWTAAGAAESLGDGYYRLDLTAALARSALATPIQRANVIELRTKTGTSTSKRATIDAQITIRSIIQAAYYGG